MTERQQTPRGRLRQWFETKTQDLDYIDVKALAEEAKAEFLSDEAWCNAMYGPMLTQELRMLIGQMRPGLLLLGDVAVDKKGPTLQERADRLRSKWAGWAEHIPSTGGYVKLKAMTAPQLLENAAMRRQRGLTEYRRAAFNERLAAELHEPGECVGDRFTDEQLEALMTEIMESDPGTPTP